MILISPVGNQPGAVAAAAATLRPQGLEAVCLLHTPPMEHHARALERLLGGPDWGLRCTLSPISASIVPATESPLPTPQQAVNALLDAHPGRDVRFYATPGLNYQIAAVARAADQSRLRPLFFEDGVLVDDLGRKTPLADIGIEALLGLHGLGLRCTARSRDGLLRQAEILNQDRPVAAFDFCYEQSGKLMGIVRLFTEQGGFGPIPPQVLAQARRIKSMVRDPRPLNHLRPRFFAFTDDPRITTRLSFWGIDVIERRPGDKAETYRQEVRDFCNRTTVPPGTRAISNASTLDAAIRPVRGKGGTHPDLLVCLGNDLAPTLLAIMSHQPRTCYLALDRTPYVRELAARLCRMAALLPVDRLIPIQTDILGRNLADPSFPPEQRPGDPLFLNLTPGSKGQTWHMALRPTGTPCTLYTASRHVQDLDGHDHFPWAMIPVRIQAEACGGPLLSEAGMEIRHLLEHEAWLEAMLQATVRTAERTKGGFVNLVLLKRGKGGVPVECELQEGKRIRIAVQAGEAMLPHVCKGESLDDGFWLEEVTAYGLWKAGQGRNLDLLMNVSWSWKVDGASKKGKFRSELDAALNWNGAFLGVSCKQGYQARTAAEQYAKARDDVIAVTRTGLGRFALPVLIGPEAPVREPDGWDEERLLELTMRDFQDLEALGGRIDEYVRQARKGGVE